MTDQPQRLSIDKLRRTTHLIRQATASFSSNLLTFLFLSLLLFSFRALVENGTHLLTSFIDRDPSLKTLLSRLDLGGHHQNPNTIHDHNPRFHRRHFLHLTRVGTLDDDFFSGDDDSDRSLFGPNRKIPPNASSVILNNFHSGFGFSHFIVDNGVRVPEIVRTGVQFNADSLPFEDSKEDENGQSMGLQKGRDLDRVVDFQFFVKGLELGRRDAAALFYLVSFLSAAYGWVILGFTAMYSWMLGIVFVAVVNDLLERFSSFVGIVWDGSRLGLKRLTGFILMRWAVRDALTQLVGLCYFGEIEDQYSFFKLFVRLKLMPFSVMSPWIGGYEKEISGFLFTWFLLDTLVGLVFAVDAWVTIVDSRRTGREIVKEGCYLISTMVLGKYLAAILQSVVEVYFMVAWLIFYFAARCKEAHSEGRRFGRRELEGLIDGLR
ncbi:unnamed protein product [Linum tenue]|uniref:Uncharacterized protein n=1 Tax=Linum tenue TaxID=586396 RepID=A0AAV0KZN8_9ROSI|nr:unnamed protein product [Linum tenue]